MPPFKGGIGLRYFNLARGESYYPDKPRFGFYYIILRFLCNVNLAGRFREKLVSQGIDIAPALCYNGTMVKNTDKGDVRFSLRLPGELRRALDEIRKAKFDAVSINALIVGAVASYVADWRRKRAAQQEQEDMARYAAEWQASQETEEAG